MKKKQQMELKRLLTPTLLNTLLVGKLSGCESDTVTLLLSHSSACALYVVDAFFYWRFHSHLPGALIEQSPRLLVRIRSRELSSLRYLCHPNNNILYPCHSGFELILSERSNYIFVALAESRFNSLTY